MMPKKNAVEWAVFAVSLALIAFIVAVLTYEHFTSADRPPSIRIVTGEPQRVSGGFAVPVDVHNDGDRTAEEVEIEILLEGSGERGGAVLAFVPHGSSRRAWVTFRGDPAGGRMTARVLGYREP